MPENKKIDQLAASLKEYMSINRELMKLEATERISVIGSGLISGLLVTILGLFFLFFVSLAAGFYFSKMTGNNYSGFLIVAAFYLLMVFILFLSRKKMVEKPLRDKIITEIFSKN